LQLQSLVLSSRLLSTFVHSFFVFKWRCVSWMQNGLTTLNFIASDFAVCPLSSYFLFAFAKSRTRISFPDCSFRHRAIPPPPAVISFAHVHAHVYTHPTGFTFEREVATGWKHCIIGLCNDYCAIGRADPAWKCSWRKWWRGRGIARPFDGAARSN